MTAPILQACPGCGSTHVVRLAEDWQSRSSSGPDGVIHWDGEPIPVVGCGAPWHYDGAPDPTAGTCPDCHEAIHDADCPRVGDGRPAEAPRG